MEERAKVLILIVNLIIFSISIVSASFESDFLNLLNKERQGLGKSIIYLNEDLKDSAYLHAKDMGDNNYFSHQSLNGRTFDKRIIDSGYSNYLKIGENIAYTSYQTDSSHLFDMWKNSPGHYEIMISEDYNEAGLGVYSINEKTYYVLDLGKRMSINNDIIDDSNDHLKPKTEESIFKTLDYKIYSSGKNRYIKITGKLNDKSQVYYSLETSKRICKLCNRFSINIKLKATDNEIILYLNNSKKNETKIINF